MDPIDALAVLRLVPELFQITKALEAAAPGRHFTYGVNQHCHTLLGCNLRQQQLQQGEHLKKKCKLWAPTWQKQVGWAHEAG